MAKDLIIRSIFALCIILYTSMFINISCTMKEDEEERKDPANRINLVYSLICAVMLLVGLSKMGG